MTHVHRFIPPSPIAYNMYRKYESDENTKRIFICSIICSTGGDRAEHNLVEIIDVYTIEHACVI